MLVEETTHSGFKCAQEAEQAKTIICFWNTIYFFSQCIKIYDNRNRIRKTLNVTGAYAMFEADELDFGETYTITLSKSRTSLTIIGTSMHVKYTTRMLSRYIQNVI